MPLPKWKCHKIVEADKITSMSASLPITFGLACGQSISVPSTFYARGLPAIGDYFVRYSDGYESWSPAKAFEEGYSRLGSRLPGDMGGFDDKV